MAPPNGQAPTRSRDDIQDAQQARMQKAIDELEKRQRAEERKVQLMEKKDHARDTLVAMITKVTEVTADLRKAGNRIGLAYSEAAKNHRAAVDKQKQMNALDAQVMFAILSVLSSGALSWLTEAAKAANAAKLAANAAKAAANSTVVAGYDKLLQTVKQTGSDPLNWGNLSRLRQEALTAPVRNLNLDRFITVTGSTVSAGVGSAMSLAPSFISVPSSEPVSEEPLTFQNKMVSRIDTVTNPVLAALSKLAEDLKTTPLEKWDTYDDKQFQAAYEKWHREVSELAGDKDLPGDQEMQDEMERFIWALWVPGLKTTEVIQGGCNEAGCWDPWEVEEYVRVRTPVNDRFVALGIETEAQTDWKRDKEDKMLIDWAGKYLRDMKPWVSGKAKAARVPLRSGGSTRVPLRSGGGR